MDGEIAFRELKNLKGFTIVVGKRKRTRYKKFRSKPDKKRIKIYYLLPVIFVGILLVFIKLSQNKKIESENKTESIPINNFKAVDDYSLYYIPIVVNDFSSYSKGDKIENSMLIKLGVWSILCTDETEKYEAFDGELVIPAEVIEEKIKKLFSKDIVIKNETVQEEKYSIIYDDETQVYIIKTIGLTPRYTPHLESAETKRNETILTVGCHKSENYKQDSSGNIVIPEAEKRLIITLSKDENGYHISEISG